MYFVDEKGNKKPVTEQFQPPSAVIQKRSLPTRENYGQKSSYPKWLYWVLGIVALILIVMLIMWAFKSKDSASMAQQRFRFRFY